MLSKKGIELLGETTIKLVVAVICIGLLSILLVNLYAPSKDKLNLQTAETHLNRIEEISVILNQTQERTYLIQPIKNWYLKSYGEGITVAVNYQQKTVKLNGCEGTKSCLCFCDQPLCLTSNNVCKNFDFTLILDESFTEGSSAGTGGVSIVTYANTIQFETDIIELNIRNENGDIYVTKK